MTPNSAIQVQQKMAPSPRLENTSRSGIPSQLAPQATPLLTASTLQRRGVLYGGQQVSIRGIYCDNNGILVTCGATEDSSSATMHWIWGRRTLLERRWTR